MQRVLSVEKVISGLRWRLARALASPWSQHRPLLAMMAILTMLFVPGMLAIAWLISVLQGPIEWRSVLYVILFGLLTFLNLFAGSKYRTLELVARLARAALFAAASMITLFAVDLVDGMLVETHPGVLLNAVFNAFLGLYFAFIFLTARTSLGAANRIDS